jgi:hypothetical protein
MNNSIEIDQILSQIKKLDLETRVNLMERISKLLKKDIQKVKSSNRLIELNGLGSEIWADINIEDYVQQERQWD